MNEKDKIIEGLLDMREYCEWMSRDYDPGEGEENPWQRDVETIDGALKLIRGNM